jgi:hypothetical protein
MVTTQKTYSGAASMQIIHWGKKKKGKKGGGEGGENKNKLLSYPFFKLMMMK